MNLYLVNLTQEKRQGRRTKEIIACEIGPYGTVASSKCSRDRSLAGPVSDCDTGVNKGLMNFEQMLGSNGKHSTIS